MSRLFPGTEVLDISPRRVDVEAEARQLVERARHGAELAEVIALARSPLPPDDEAEAEPDDELESRLAEQAKRDLALLASAETLRRPPRRPWAPRRHAERKAFQTKPAEPVTPATTPPAPRRGFVVDVQRRRVLTASGRVVPNGWALVWAHLHGEVAAVPTRRRRR